MGAVQPTGERHESTGEVERRCGSGGAEGAEEKNEACESARVREAVVRRKTSVEAEKVGEGGACPAYWYAVSVAEKGQAPVHVQMALALLTGTVIYRVPVLLWTSISRRAHG